MQSDQFSLFSELLSAREKGLSVVMVTVIDVQGSAPQKGGARMLVYDDGRTSGTIGGGAIEQMAIKEATSLLQTSGPVLREYNLDQDANMLCGGRMRLFFEPVNPPLPLYIFGGGHIGSALCRILIGAGFAITVVDNRPEFAAPERFPKTVSTLSMPYDQALKSITFNDRTSAIIVTHGHAHDQEIADHCIRQPFLYLGMIGSKSKVAKTRKFLMENGVSKKQLSRLHSPIGLDIGGSTPAEIAISIAAELIAVKNQAAILKRPA